MEDGLSFQTKKDFYNWMRLYLMVLVSGAITIHAVIYPSAPIAEESIRAALQRAIFGLFLTKIDDLDGTLFSFNFQLTFIVHLISAHLTC